MIEINLNMNPPTVTHQEHKVTVRGGKPKFNDSPRLKATRAMFEGTLKTYRPAEPLEGALELSVEWRFFSRSHKEGEYRITRPDTDNLQKLLKDCMTKVGFWKDDAQVCRETVTKKWSRSNPGLTIKVVNVHDA